MPRWLSGLGYVLGLLDCSVDSLRCSYFFTFFATHSYTTTITILLLIQLFLQKTDYIMILRLI